MSAAAQKDYLLTPYRVLDLAGESGLMCGKLLGDLGAEVIIVEPPGGHPARGLGPFYKDEIHPEKSLFWFAFNTSKKGITLDLTRAAGQQLLKELVRQCDIVIESFAPGYLDALGLGYAELSAVRPDLVFTSITPFGQKGPRRDWKGTDLTLQARCGLQYLLGDPDRPPVRISVPMTAVKAGVEAANATLFALFHRNTSGEGQHVDVSIQECIAAILEMNFMHYSYGGRETSRLGRRSIFPWCMLDCQDGKIFVINVEEDQWQRLVELMGNPEWASLEIFKDRVTRGQNYDALFPLLQEWAANWKVADLYKAAQERRICFAPVNTMADLFASAHLKAREFFTRIGHQVAGTLTYPGAPFKASEAGWAIQRPAPLLGQHSAEVYGRLGLSQAELESLQQQGVI